MTEQKAIESLQSIRQVIVPKDKDSLASELYEALGIAIDAIGIVEKGGIVHCKYCKFLGIKDFVYGYCQHKMTGIIRPDDFCSYGERREKKMSIERFAGFYTPTCDICGEELQAEFDFYDAVQAKKDAGWKSQKHNGEWQDVCTDCQERSQHNDKTRD